MSTKAEIAAQAAKDAIAKELENKFSYVDDAYTQAQEAAKANTENTISQLTQSASDYQKQYETDARSAYINKMQSDLALDSELTRLGLSNTGYGVTQKLGNQSSYGQNLTNLQNTLSKNLTSIEQSKATANTELGNTLADLASNYASQKTSIDQYVTDALQSAYDTAYERTYQEEQDAISNALSWASLYSSNNQTTTDPTFSWTPGTTFANASNGNMTYTNPNGASVTVKTGVNPYTNTMNSDAKDSNGNYDSSKVFSNGYQPNNVNGTDVKSVKGESVTINGNSQKVWSAGNKYYVWDGLSNKYRQVVKKNGQWVVK